MLRFGSNLLVAATILAASACVAEPRALDHTLGSAPTRSTVDSAAVDRAAEGTAVASTVADQLAGDAEKPPAARAERSTVAVGRTSTSATLPADRPSVASPVSTTSGAPVATSVRSSVPQTIATTSTTSTPSLMTTSTVVDRGRSVHDPQQDVALSFESRVADVTTADLERQALDILNDPRGWGQAGFRFRSERSSELRVVLAEGPVVDELCRPLRTGGTVSCQNGATVALNADRWRVGVAHWDSTLEDYRGYLVNHEIGHLFGQRHPKPRCPRPGAPAAVMEQQTGSLSGCTGNPWPRPWEIERARSRPVIYAPLPDWAPPPVPSNLEK